MKGGARGLLALTLACTVAAAIFGFGSEVFSWRSAYAEESGRTGVILTTRLAVYVALTVLLVFRGGWWGVPAAVSMAIGATLIEWALFPLAFDWAAIEDPSGYEERFGEVGRPTYWRWSAFDIAGVALCAAIVQGLRVTLGLSEGPRDG
ncbi:MAG: hypothetical protein AB1425_04540 [Actinomycetota bacterium]